MPHLLKHQITAKMPVVIMIAPVPAFVGLVAGMSVPVPAIPGEEEVDSPELRGGYHFPHIAFTSRKKSRFDFFRFARQFCIA
jgi:hypothetical protein